MRPSRRDFLKAGGVAIGGFALAPNGGPSVAALLDGWRGSAPALEVIEMRSDTSGSLVWFDPIGLYVELGATVRWVVRENVHTTTAYHPRNDDHSLRIPEGAVPWDSGFLVDPGDHFDVALTVPGVYDYYCMPHEAAGMVGRIVVRESLGPGTQPFDYWAGKPGTDRWRRVPDAARENLPSVARIIAERRVRSPGRRGETAGSMAR